MKKVFIVIISMLICAMCFSKNTNYWWLSNEIASIGYSHSVANLGHTNGTYSFNHINEIWTSIFCFEMSFYWDSHNYGEYYDSFVESVNDKSHIDTNVHYSQDGYMGFKLGFKAKYFSIGVVFDLGADNSYFKTEQYNLYYINSYTNYWEFGTDYNQYSEGGFGLYGKVHYPFPMKMTESNKATFTFEPFVAIQCAKNKNNFICVGVSICFGNWQGL